MIQHIDHIGIAVKKIEAALPFYQKQLGFSVASIEEIPSEKVRIAILPVGKTNLELLEATSDDSPIAKFIAKQGEGIHHIAFAIEKDLPATLKQLDQNGICLVNKEPKIGASGKQIAFLHPKSTFGSLIELVKTGAL